MPFRRSFSAIVSIILMLALALLLIPAGCAPKLPPEPEWEQQANGLLDQAQAFFSKRQYDQAAKVVDDFFARYPKSRHADRALLIMGDVRLSQRNYRQALSYYKDIIEKYPSSPYKFDAKYKLGRCYFELKEYDLAVGNLEDRTGITDPVQLYYISEMLSYAYQVKKNYPAAIREFVYLVDHSTNTKQQAGYRDRIREIIEKNLTEDELKKLASGTAYPSDIARLRLAEVQLQQREYRDAASTSRDFLDRFPGHPEKTRAEMILNQAMTMLASPRYAVGVLVPQSGQLAFFGDRVLRGSQLAVNVFNQQEPDNRVELIAKDTEGQPDKVVTSMNELAAKKVVAAIGPITTKAEEAIAPLIEKLQIPVIRPAASRAGISPSMGWIFRNALTIDSQAQAAARYALSQKFKKIVIFYPDDPYGKDLSRLFSRELERKATILASIAYPTDAKDFGPYIRRLMEIDLRSRKIRIPDDEAERKKLLADYTPGFDALYLPGYADQVGLLIPQLAFYNIEGKSMIGSDNWHSPNLLDRAGKYAEGAVFVDGFSPENPDPAVQAFVASYRSAYQEDPDILAAQAYDAAMIIFQMLKQHKDSPLAIRDGLLALKDYPGITGSTTFAGSGEAQKKLFLIKIEDGAFKLMGTAP